MFKVLESVTQIERPTSETCSVEARPSKQVSRSIDKAKAVGPGEGGGGRGRPPRGLGRGKPQKTSQSPDRQYKDMTDYTKPPKDYTKPLNIRQHLRILNKYLKCLTRVATNINITQTT